MKSPLTNVLLADDGAIFTSIDDAEQANLRLICDEIFGANSFAGILIWQKRTSPDARKKLSNGHEYIVTYTKSGDMIAHSICLTLRERYREIQKS